jgi:hypothetical protein
MSEGQRFARRHVRSDVLVEYRLLLSVGGEDHHHVGSLSRLADRDDLESLRLRLGP